MANAASATLSIVATVTTHTLLTNTATASTTTYDQAPGNNAAAAVVNVPDANLAVSKTVSNATPALNSNVTFTVTVTNNGPDSAQSVSVADALPAGLTLVSATPSTGSYAAGVWTIGTMANAASATLSIVATVTTHTAITNTATASTTTYDPTAANNAASASVDVPNADLAVTKTVSNATPGLNTNVTFTVTVTNNGPDSAQSVSVADALPAGLTLVSATPSTGSYAAGVWTVGTMANAASATLSIVATVTTHTAITNTATASTTTYDPTAGNNSASAAVDVPDANLSVTKIVNDPTPEIGQNVTFTVTVANAGPNAAQAVSVADALPAGLTLVSATPSVGTYASGTWAVGNLANGTGGTLSIVATVTATGAITNTAVATSTTYDPTAANNTANATVNGRQANLSITKTVSNATPALNSNVTFTVIVTNGGPDTASGVAVADALPAGLTLVSATPSVGTYAAGTWTVGALTNAASATLSIVATVTVHTAVTNNASVSATTYDPTPGNNTASASVNVPDANLAVAKTVSDATPTLNSNVTFTVTVTNNGPDAAVTTTVADALPAGLTLVSATPSVGSYSAGSWLVGNLANGASATLTIVATVTTHTAITNTATASSSTYDPVAGNDAASATVNVPDADLAVTKTVNTATPVINSNVTFTVTVTNNGPNASSGVTVADALPAGLTLVSATPSAGSYAAGIWSVGTVANGGVETLAIVATVTSHTLITNSATVAATTLDPVSGNNTASASVDAPDANLAVTKTVSNATPALNGNVTFTVTVTNNGRDTAVATTVADALPVGLTLVSAAPSVGSYAGGTWTVGNLTNGASATLTIVATVTVHTAVTNTAVATSSTYDPTPADNTASATINVPDANLVVTKAVDDTTPAVGANVAFTVTVTNSGPDAAQSVVVADALPAGLTLVSSSPSVGTYAGGTWTVGTLANGAGATLGIVATVTVPTARTNTATATSSTYDPTPANNTASATVGARDADLTVTKTVSNATPVVGANVTFTVTVTNNGPDTAQAVSVADALPAGLTLVSATPSTGTYASGTWTVGSLTNGAGATLSVVATVTVPTVRTNTATGSSSTFDPTPADNSASASVDARDADLAVTKTVDTATPSFNGQVTFVVSVTDNGPDTSTGVSVADALPAGLILVSATTVQGTYTGGVWTIGSITSGATASLSIVAQVTTHTALTNTASVSATTFDPVAANNAASATVNVPDADLAVTKTVTDATPAVGSNVVFTVTVTNTGVDTAQGVAVADALPAGLTLVSSNPSVGTYAAGTWTLGALASGASATLQITATVTGYTQITNTATVTSSTYDPIAANNSASASVNAPDADVQVTKTVNDTTPALNGNVTFTISVRNNGPDGTSGVTVLDALPAGLTLVSATPSTGGYAGGLWTVGNLANGASATLSVVATVTTHLAVTNTATVNSGIYDPVSGNDTASASLNVPDADLAVTKTVNTSTPAFGTDVTFTVTVTNNGPDTSAGVSVADSLPAGLTLVSATADQGGYASGTWTVGSLTNGTTRTLTLVATVTNHLPITNTATASATTYDPIAANNAASASVDVRDADLVVTKVVDNPTPLLGANVTFTVTVHNNGPDTSTGVLVADALPAGLTFVSAGPSQGGYAAGTWTVGSLANNATATLTIVATVTAPGALTNTATASATTYDPTGSNNSSFATVGAQQADLAVTKTVDDPTPSLNGTVTYLVSVTNNGPDAAPGARVDDVLPPGLTLLSATPSVGAYAPGTGVWTVGTLANGATATLAIVARVTTHTLVTNTASATSDLSDPVPANNVASADVNVPDANLAVVKTVSNATPDVGANVTFTITLTNNGPDASQGVTVTDALPAGLTLVSATPSTGSFAGGVWTVGTLANGASANLSVIATVTTHTPITNSATAAATTFDPVAANNTSSVGVNARDADLAVTKTVSDATPALGANVTFTVTVANGGPDAAQSVSVADALPSGLTFVSATPSAGSYAAGVWTIGTLNSGAVVDLDIVATVTGYTLITNTATVSSSTFDPTPADTTASASLDVPNADLAVTKTVSDATPALNSNVTYLVTVTNNGPDAAQSVVLADALPAGLTLVSATPSVGSYSAGVWTVGTVANGAAPTLSIVATVTAYTQITNTASASTSTHDPVAANNTASASLDVPNAGLAVTKTVSDATPPINTDVTFVVTVTNNGPDAAQSVVLADALPAGLTLVSATPSVGSYSAGVWTVGTVANGAAPTLSIVATVTAYTQITNTASASTSTHDPVAANNTASASLDVPNADLAVTKTVSDATPELGADVTFTVTVTNNGSDTAQGVTVADVLPAGLTLVSSNPSTGTYASGVWTVGMLANGAAATLGITATVTSTGTITNTATASTATHDPIPGNNAASASLNGRRADLVLTKSVNAASPALGANVTFTITVANSGPDPAAGVSVADALPGGLTFVSASPSAGAYAAGVWTVGTLANGASATLDIVATVTAVTPITNTAIASATTFDPDNTDNADSATVNVPEADVAVTKTVDTATPALNGVVTFTIAVTNNGPDTAAGVNVADVLPAGLTQLSATPSVGTYSGGNWAVGNLANGAGANLQVTARVTVDAPITNTATISTATFDANAANDSDAASVDVPTADLAVTKTVDNATPQFGANAMFTVTVINNGPDAAANVNVADALPAGLTPISATPSVGSYSGGVWTVGTLANGASATLSVQAQVAGTAPITNTATATTATHDPNSADDSDSASVDAPAADLAVTKTVDNPSPSVGTNVTFTVTVANNGPDAATGVVVSDLLPAGLTFQSAIASAGSYNFGTGAWTVGNLANGASENLQITAQVTVAGGLVNTATASATEHDPNLADNSDSATVAGVRADVALTKTVDDATPALGGTATFTVTVVNNGPDAATGVVVTDLLPAGLTFQSAIASVGSYNFGTGAWTVGNLANGASETLSIMATVTVTTPVTNTATATATTFDQAPGNNSASASVDVQNADLAITKTVDDPTPAINGTVTYLLTVTNNGPDTATGTTASDLLPAGLTLLTATPSTGAYTAATGAWNIGTMANGATQTLVIVARVTTHTAVANTASVTSTTLDQVAANDVDTATVNVPDADLAISKSVSTSTPALGANVTFTIDVTNNGPDIATAASITDLLPAGLTFVSAIPTVGAYTSATGAWAVGDLAGGATETLTIVATVTVTTPITNTATATSDTYDPTTPNTAAASVDVQQGDIAVTKTVDDATPAFGGTVTFTVTARNNGPDSAAAVSVADSLPGGLALVSATPSVGGYAAGTWTIGTLANGQTATLTIVATVNTSAPVTNVATASTSTVDTNAANDSASASVNAPDADLAVTKTVDDATPAPNGSATFTVTVINNGPDTAPAVHVADVLPAGLTLTSATATAGTYAAGDWNVGALPNSATVTLTIVATVGSSAPITNTATVTSDAFDANPANDTDAASVDVPDADLAVTKTVDDATPAINATVAFTVTVVNNGPDTAPGTRVADALPAGLTLLSATPSTGTYAVGVWAIGAMVNGATETLIITARVTSSALITNTATATSRAADPGPGDESASASVDVPEADVAVTKTVSDPTPALNANVTFTVTVTNNGPRPALGVTVADTLPAGLSLVSSAPSVGSYSAGTWTIGGLASGASETLDVVATVTGAGPITNTATVSSTSYDGTAANDSDSASVDVPEADLAITKAVSNATPALGGNVTFSLAVTNNGPSAASAVVVTDALPAGLTFVSASSPAYVGSTWTIGNLANGGQATLDIVAQVTSAAVITNTATVTSSTLDTGAGNNSDAATVDVPQADLTLTKTVDDATPNEGQNVTYTLTLTNNGPDAAGGVDVTDVLPAGLTFVSATPSAGAFAADVWSLASVPSGATRSLDIVATVTAQGAIVNDAEVTASGTLDPTSTPGDGTGDDAASVSLTALPPSADLSLTLAAGTPSPTIGGTLTYTLTVTNSGPSATSGVEVIDLLPAGVTYNSSSATLGSYDSGSGTWTIGALASGQTVTLSIVVTVDQSGLIRNTAEVGASTVPDPDSTPANASGSEDDESAVDINAQGVAVTTSANLQIVKSASQSVATIGDTISYAIVVTNNGPAAATNVQVLEQLPSALQFVSARASIGVYDLSTFVWSIPNIANGGSASLIVTTRVVAPGSVTNTVQVLAADQPDPDGPFNLVPGAPGGEQASATVAVSGPAPAPTRLTITKVGTKVIKAGGTVTFTIRLKNSGTVPATNIVMTDCVPIGMSLKRGVKAGALRKNGQIGWQVGTLQPGQSRVVRVVLRADRDTRGMRSCAAVASAANAASVRAVAGVRVVAGAAVSNRARVTG